MDRDQTQLLIANQIADRLAELHEEKKFHKFQTDVIKAIFEHGKKRIFIRKGRKGGGTECVLYPAARIAGLFPNKACYIIGPTQKAQSEIIWDNRRLHNFIPSAWNAVPNEKDKRMRLPNQSFIKIEGADNPDAARGWEGDLFIWDELKDHNPRSLENCYPNVMARDGIWIELGTPPTTKDNHYYQHEQRIKNDPDWAFFHWTAWDNPFLPGGHEYLRKEKEKYYARGDWDLWEIEYEARYVFNAQRKVIPNFKSEVHVYPRDVIMSLIARDMKSMKWLVSIDPGYATCFAALFIGYNPYTSQIFKLDEIYSLDRNRNSVIEMWPLIERKQKELCPEAFTAGKWINIYDSAAAAFAVEVHAHLREQGRKTKLYPTEKQPNDEDDYFRAINSSYSEVGRVMVAQNCENYIREIENYETDDKDNYPDKNNHQLDNDRYLYKYLGYHQLLKQGTIKAVDNLPRGVTPEEEFSKQQKDKDFVGFGGVDASFDVSDMVH